MQSVEADGMIFASSSVQGEIIKEEADYQGVRVSFLGFLGKAQVHMRLDVGFTDVVTPSPVELELPTILDHMSKPCLRIYPPETVIAEKFHSMIALGMINSRMKDFYDIWFMARTMEFDLSQLREAILNTFERRKTILPKVTPIAFTNDFAEQKQVLWASFLKKNQIEDAPKNLVEAILVLKEFLDPMILPAENKFSHWSPPIGWK